MINLLLTLVAGLACGFFAYKLKVPGGMMVGAIIGAAALNILFGAASMPSTAKTAAQIIAGSFIGCSAEKSDIKRIPVLMKPISLLIGSMLILNLALGFLIWRSSPIDLLTALFCAVPGGMTDIPIIASDMGADASKVVVMQFLRMFAGIGLFPSFILAYSSRKEPGAGHENREQLTDGAAVVQYGMPENPDTGSPGSCFMTLALAAACGLAGRATGIPAGTLVFSMLGTLIYKLSGRDARMPAWIKRGAQALSGAYIGSGMSREAMLELKYLAVPAFLLVAGYFLNCLITGNLLHRWFGLSYKEAMLAVTPAGASDMALISADLGVGSSDLAELQIFRMIIVISIFPQIIAWIVKMW